MRPYDTGERISAIMSLTFEDFSGDGVIFRAAHRKGNRRDIYRQIGQETVDAINVIRGTIEKKFGPGPIIQTIYGEVFACFDERKLTEWPAT